MRTKDFRKAISDSGHEVDALGHTGDEGRTTVPKECGELPMKR